MHRFIPILFVAVLTLFLSDDGAIANENLPIFDAGKRFQTQSDSQSKGSQRRVIVTLKRTAQLPAMENLSSPFRRTNRKERIRNLQDRVLSKIDPSKIREKRRFSYTPAFSALLAEKEISQLKQMDEVASVEEDPVVYPHTRQGIALMNASQVSAVYKGQGIAIAILDTGIDYNHPALGNGGFPNSKVIGGYDFGDNDGNPMDFNGHGTSCAGIAAGDAVVSGDYIGGVAPEAKLYALKITRNNNFSAFLSTIIQSIEWCIDHAQDDPDNPIKIISISFGGDQYFSQCDTISTSFTLTASMAVSAGITLFSSSGNEGYCGSMSSPACFSDVISVGAVFDDNIGGWGYCVDPSSCAFDTEANASCSTGTIAWVFTTAGDQVAPYSNLAGFLDLFAPSHFAVTPTLGSGYRTDFGGTSAACPYAAGVAACMQSAVKQAHNTYLSPALIRSQMTGSGDLLSYSGSGFSLQKPRVNLGATDMDEDGMPSAWEVEFFGDIATASAVSDTDGDGLTDPLEYANSTDPTKADTDDDLMTDGWEVSNNLDPLSDDANQDPDGDGSTNIEEFQAGTDPRDPASYPMPVPGAKGPATALAWLVLVAFGIKALARRQPPLS